jgi:hypothetical protein
VKANNHQMSRNIGIGYNSNTTYKTPIDTYGNALIPTTVGASVDFGDQSNACSSNTRDDIDKGHELTPEDTAESRALTSDIDAGTTDSHAEFPGKDNPTITVGSLFVPEKTPKLDRNLGFKGLKYRSKSGMGYLGLPIMAPRPPTFTSKDRVNKTPHNKRPPKVSGKNVSDATLMKRGLSRGYEEDLCKRAQGANDPENIHIVDWAENEGMRWGEIAQRLNEERLKMGLQPTFTPNAVHARFNRNAPILYEAEGKVFVPLNKRDGTEGTRTLWNKDLDRVLVECIKEYDSERWPTVADMFNDRTQTSITAKTAASRYMTL